MLKKIAHFFDIRQSPVVFHVRKHGVRKAAPPLMVLTSVALAGVVLIAQNGKPTEHSAQENPQQVATPATQAQPFPGEGFPALPAITAQPPLPQKLNTTENILIIIAPAGGRGWVRGSGSLGALPIIWIWNSTKPHPQGIVFDVNLLKGGSFFRKITSVTNKLGEDLLQMRWEIPSDIPTGSDYTIEVVTADRKGSDKKDALLRDVSDVPFAILGESITISGRFIDKLTQEPVANLRLVRHSSAANPEIFTGQNGEFTYMAETDGSGGGGGYAPTCYMQGVIYASYSQNYLPGYKTGPESYGIFTFNINSFDFFVYNGIEADSRLHIPILSDRLDLGDVAVRPAGNIRIFGDIPFEFHLDYSSNNNYIDGPGTAGYGPGSGLNNVFPLEYEARVALRDQAGTEYFSPPHKVGSDKRCKNVIVAFLNKEFSWQPYEITFTTGGYGGGRVGIPFSLPVTVEGGTAPYTWSIVYGTLPLDLRLDATTGEISGIPETAGNYLILVKVTDQNGVSNGRGFSIPINSP